MAEHMNELVNFNWASRAEKRVLCTKMARKWRERVAEEFETRREGAAIDVCFNRIVHEREHSMKLQSESLAAYNECFRDPPTLSCTPIFTVGSVGACVGGRGRRCSIRR